MPKPINIQERGGYYHIYFKTHHDRFYLVEGEDILKLGAYMNVYKKKRDVKLHAFEVID